MFRTAVLRTSASAVRAVARPVAIRRTAAAAFAAPRAAAPLRVQSFMGVRMYSAGGGLNKEEVEGRIMSLLQGFDKVRVFFCFCAENDVARRDAVEDCRRDAIECIVEGRNAQ